MRRFIEDDLLNWKSRKNHLPLILRGARQTGKSFLIEKFGKTAFENCVVANFEQRPDLKRCFETLEPQKIIADIELRLEASIKPGTTLLFLDEIQECPQAIVALRYFKEQMPMLHVIAAGSLLEFVLNDAEFRMPVGRVQFLYLYPLSFTEYLEAAGFQKLRTHLKQIDLKSPLAPDLHELLLNQLREYVTLGGMPAVLSEYFETKNLQQTQEMQSALLQTYRNDFSKYAKQTQHKYLQLLFERSPGLIAQWFKYAKVDPDVQSRDIKMALEKLVDAGLLHLVHATNASGLPLITTMNPKKFKLLFLDVGLAKRAYHLNLPLLFERDVMLINQGMLSEQLVGQELLASMDKHEAGRLFFWVREQKSSNAEVDYVITVGTEIIPIEVKSGTTGRLKSLKIFMDEKSSKLGVRISQAPLALEGKILSVPFYLISELPRLIENAVINN